ncbi:MAG: hypothetical protein BGO69_19225 [Bacteroidetes bacterium 46-16]|nr:MAG: hypothetical protein BGO69_19225 [Bacteroidetes bacterium 46-16]
MIALIKQNIEKIQALCSAHYIKSLYLIGSAARAESNFLEDSDVDFLYQFNSETMPESDYADHYFELLFGLQELLKRKVDLVAEERIKNPYFIQSINKDKFKLYES